MAMLTIGQIATRAGVRASAIRYYESRGLLPAASRDAGKRVYDVSVLERLAVIANRPGELDLDRYTRLPEPPGEGL